MPRAQTLARFSPPTSVTLGQRANEHRKGFFAGLMAALEESRRREANRIIGQYRHLIADGGDRWHPTPANSRGNRRAPFADSRHFPTPSSEGRQTVRFSHE